ncbi:MAG: LytR/AlgR family response regulator transcription factor [Candidatus Weimeria sp.]
MIYKIGICDDEKESREMLSRLCLRAFDEAGEKCEIIEFSSGRDLMENVTQKIHLLLLDIELGDSNGIDLMNTILGNNLIWRIAFVTSYEKYIAEAFSIKTIGYGIKPLKYSLITRWIRTVISEDRKNSLINLKTSENTTIRLFYDDIMYIRSAGNYLNVITRMSHYLIRDTMHHMEQLLDGNTFIRCHRTCIVNLNSIFDTDDISCEGIKVGNELLPVRRGSVSEIKKALSRYQNNLMINRVR